MEQQDSDEMIPPQHVGKKLDTDNMLVAPSTEEAQKFFEIVSTRLLDVNAWDKIAGPLSAVFRLTDASGNEISGPAKAGDFFKIDIPGPGPAAGDGFDWVRIEAVEDQRNPSGNEESITMRVRPAPSPLNDNPDTAHFFKEDATSSFQVIRSGNELRAEVHGRNEVPNTDVHTTRDKVRNAVVGTGAVSGMSSPQWQGLVNGLLKGL